MSEERDDGGTAFPFIMLENTVNLESGMSLRDWFAGLAMQGILAGGGQMHDMGANKLSQKAYARADAMLKERTK